MLLGLGTTDPALRRAWRPLCRASDATTRLREFTLLGQNYVEFRSPEGEVRVFVERCPHRFAPLSLGASKGA
ncbi:MAG: Rieske 2Fe-2S domain-containing protein [Acidimicrobiales bacterium]